MKRILRVLMLLCLITIPSLVRAAVSVSVTSSSNLSGCNSVNANFTANTTECAGTVTYTWYYIKTPASSSADTITIPGGTNPTNNHTFGGIGTYNVVVKAKCGLDSAYSMLPGHVTVSNMPAVGFAVVNPADTLKCAGAIAFKNTTTGDTSCPGHTWQWIVSGPGTVPSQSGTTATFNFTTPGYYTITLLYQSTCGCVGAQTRASYIHIAPNPVACITRTDASLGCSAPVTATFSAGCSSGATSYSWTFTGNPPYNSTSPSDTTATSTFSAPGNFNVNMVATSSVGCTANSNTIVVHVGNFTANFPATAATVCELASLTVTDNTTTDVVAPVTQNFYVFDPANMSAGPLGVYPGPTATIDMFFGAGNFIIIDSLINGNGCTSSASHPLTVRARPGVAATSDANYKCSQPFTVNFAATPVVATTTYTWLFAPAATATFTGTGATGANPTYTYTANGTYNPMVKVVDQFGCRDSALTTTPIVVGLPRSSFTTDVDSGCAPILATFSAALDAVAGSTVLTAVPPISSFTVDSVVYGDGTRDVNFVYSGSFTHTYSTDSNFVARIYYKMDAVNGGCLFSDSVHVRIGGTRPVVNVISYPIDPSNGSHLIPGDSVCPHTSVFFRDYGCDTCHYTKTWSIRTGEGTIFSPIADPLATPPISADSATAVYDIPSSQATVSTNPWTYTLTSCLHGCCSADTGIIFVFPPVVQPNSILSSKLGHCARYDSVDFTLGGLSGLHDTTVYYYWQFDYPSTAPVDVATIRGPLTGSPMAHHAYGLSTPGTHIVMVTAMRPGPFNGPTRLICTNSVSDTIYVGPQDKNWSIDDTVVCKNDVVTFHGPHQLDGTAYPQYIWSFGDGVTTTVTTFDSTTTHVYTSTGVFTDRVIFRNNFNCPDTGVIKHVHVNGPVGGFVASPNPICANAPVTFTDNNTFTIGTSIFSRKVSYDYAATAPALPVALPTSPNTFTHSFPRGEWIVALSDQDNSARHCASFDTIRIKSVEQDAYFTSSDTTGLCAGLPVAFHDTNTHCTYFWSFGDGLTAGPSATLANTSHVYTANGVYTVSVTIVSDGTGNYPLGCTSTFTRNNYIHLTNASGITIANYGDTVTGCQPLQIIAGPSNTPTSYLYTYAWFVSGAGTGTGLYPSNTPFLSTSVYGPGSTGTHTLTLIATSPAGCADSISRNYIIGGPDGNITVTPTAGCGPLTVALHFNNIGVIAPGSNYIWNACPFGSFTTAGPDTTITYNTAGVYCPPSVTIQGGSCAATFADTAQVYVFPSPVVSVLHAARICYGGSDTLVGVGADTYQWIGPGVSPLPSTFTVVSPLTTTTYTVVGTNIPQGCTDTAYVTVVVDAPIVVTISGRDSVCIGENDTLTAAGGSGVFSWHYPPGISCPVCNPVIITTTTTRTYWAVTTNAVGCTDSASFTVTINPLPVLHVTPDPAYVCEGSTRQLIATGASKYLWTPRIGLSCDSCSNPVTSVASNIIYSLTGTTKYGCTDSITVPVEVYHHNVVSKKDDTTICINNQAFLTVRGGVSYVWSPAASLNNATIYNPTATPTVTTVYTVVVTENPCFDTTVYVKVTVIPTPVLRVPPTITIIAGNSVQLYADSLNHVTLTGYAWTPADSTLSCTDCPHPIATPYVTTTYSVTATTIEGCAGTATVTIKLLCETSQVFIPNTFTPNGDGNNDRFYVSGKGLGIIKRMAVYNRWGEMVYETYDAHPNDPAIGWDGTYRGEILAPDVYIYILDVTCSTGEPFVFKGDISLVR